MSYQELSDWLGEPNTRWVDAVAERININFLTLQQILDLYLEYRVLLNRRREEASTSGANNSAEINPFIPKNATWDYYLEDFNAFSLPFKEKMKLFGYGDNFDDQYDLSKIIRKAGFLADPSKVNSWRFSDSITVFTDLSLQSHEERLKDWASLFNPFELDIFQPIFTCNRRSLRFTNWTGRIIKVWMVSRSGAIWIGQAFLCFFLL